MRKSRLCSKELSRRELLTLALAGVTQAWQPALAAAVASSLLSRRPIPSSRESLPVIGCGTWQTFDVGDAEPERMPLLDTLSTLFAAGGSVVDTSPMYGRSERVLGEMLARQKSRGSAFLATKVWTRGAAAGRAQLQQSFELLKTDRLDLVQVHNLLDWQTHLPMLRALKTEGRIRYVGVTHYEESAYDELETVMKSQPIDFMQVNYSVEERAAERRILPLAQERGIAVLINRPFGGGGTLRRLLSQPLPSWAPEAGCQSWAQLLLRFVLGHPAVTCVIPGTGRPDYMRDNLAAGMGTQPDAQTRERISAAVHAA